jgi:hypothetical protein
VKALLPIIVVLGGVFLFACFWSAMSALAKRKAKRELAQMEKDHKVAMERYRTAKRKGFDEL